MHKIEKSELPDKLKEEIRRIFGKDIKHTRDCKVLADQIFKYTNRSLSISTLKRFFGIVHTSFQPSKFTLDTLAAYAGFENMESRINPSEKKLVPDNILQEKLRTDVEKINKKSFYSVSQKTGYNRARFFPRDFAGKFLDAFLKSDKTAAMLVAPSGYGKSATLLQWFEDNITSSDQKNNDDIVCLIDGGTFFTIYNITHNLAIVNQLIDFNEKASSGIFGPEFEKDSWRYIIVIDDIDVIFSRKERYYELAENIVRIVMMHSENKRFKIILTCRPENVDPFTSLIKNNPLLMNFWFKVNFNHKNYSDFINIPLMNREEFKLALFGSESNLPIHFFSFYHPELLRVLNMPSYFSLILQTHSISSARFSEIEILDNLISHIIYLAPFAEQKQLLIKTFFKLCNADENSDLVNKEMLLGEIECSLAYREMLKSGFIYEKIVSDVFKVGISNRVFYDFLLFKYHIQGRELNGKLFKEFFANYQNDLPAQSAVIKWFVKFAFDEQNIKLLKQMYQFIQHQGPTHPEISEESAISISWIFHNTFSECLRYYRDLCKVLLPWLAKTQQGRNLYFEDFFDWDNLMFSPLQSLKVFLNHDKTADGLIFVHYIRFIKGFYALKPKTCSLEYEHIKKIKISAMENPISIARYYASQLLYSTIIKKEKNPDIINSIISVMSGINEEQYADSKPNAGFYIICALNTCNLFDEVLFFSRHIEKQNGSGCFYQYFKLCRARALLHLKKEKEALIMYRNLKKETFPPRIHHFMKMNTDIIRAEFLFHLHRKTEAVQLLSETKSLADFLGFRFIVQQATAIELQFKKPEKNNLVSLLT
jgi:hypothetical protein